jgi:exopolyphosphatase/guanosine-5'-triphosphate,3'-diphosphate pyrophosphatase
MKVGAIDIGTNTVRLLVSEHVDGKWRDIAREMDIARLGEGVNETRQIKPEAIERAVVVLSRYKEEMDRFGVERYRAVATSAMRDARNADDFTDLVKECINLAIEVIGGEEEGRLTFSGAMGRDSIIKKGCSALVIDVGGGSTEFIAGISGEVLTATSIDIGSVRITESFLKNDPPTEAEITAARRQIRDMMAQAVSKASEVKPATIVAVAGTATQLSALVYEVEPYDPVKIHGSLLRFTDLESLSVRLASMTVKERKKLTGMHPKRADVIIAGAIILEEVLLGLGYPMLVVSEKDILDGIAYSMVP